MRKHAESGEREDGLTCVPLYFGRWTVARAKVPNGPFGVTSPWGCFGSSRSASPEATESPAVPVPLMTMSCESDVIITARTVIVIK